MSANHFDIRLGKVSNVEALLQRLEQIKSGVPNYFGEQRFGFKGNNLIWANRMADGEVIKNKKIKGFALSASRSYLFNQVISERISQGIFNKPQQGDVFMLSGSNSFFCESVTEDIETRLNERDIHISAPLFGQGELVSTEKTLVLEAQVVEPFENWLNMLVDNGLKQERRSIVLYPENLTWQQVEQDVHVSFDLPTGCFATSVLRECINIRVQEETNEDSDQ